MSPTLTKRLLGACVLVAATLILTSLLPAPHSLPPRDPTVKRVTYDLQQPATNAETSVDASAAAPQAQGESIPAAAEPTLPPPLQPQPAARSEPRAAASGGDKVLAPPAEPHQARPISNSPAQSVAAAAPKPAAEAGWYVQIGAFAKLANAQRSVERLKAEGIAAKLDRLGLKGGTRYRVRCGPLASADDARKLRERVARAGFDDARVAAEAR